MIENPPTNVQISRNVDGGVQILLDGRDLAMYVEDWSINPDGYGAGDPMLTLTIRCDHLEMDLPDASVRPTLTGPSPDVRGGCA
ncbi:hypothetical protein [Brachybacterium hainanense]|uniref:Uncharacterized protein n=1 Tax=Brachybacterium hainanense TaxID=1541174 RepID=A0ABV6RCD0_9MICO